MNIKDKYTAMFGEKAVYPLAIQSFAELGLIVKDSFSNGNFKERIKRIGLEQGKNIIKISSNGHRCYKANPKIYNAASLLTKGVKKTRKSGNFTIVEDRNEKDIISPIVISAGR